MKTHKANESATVKMIPSKAIYGALMLVFPLTDRYFDFSTIGMIIPPLKQGRSRDYCI